MDLDNKEVVSEEFMETPDDLKPDTEPEVKTEDEHPTEGDTDSDTATADTKDDTPDEVWEEFKQLGLDKKFSTPKDALQALPHLNDRLGWAENQLFNRPREEKPVKVKLDPQAILEEINTDPEGAIKKVTEPQLEELRQTNSALYQEVLGLKRQQVVSDTPELRDVLPYLRRDEYPPLGKNKYWDEIVNVVRGNPMYAGKPDHIIISDAFDRIKDRVKATEKPKVSKVPDKTKASANTAGGPKKTPTDPNWTNLSPRQMKERAEKLGLVADD